MGSKSLITEKDNTIFWGFHRGVKEPLKFIVRRVAGARWWIYITFREYKGQ